MEQSAYAIFWTHFLQPGPGLIRYLSAVDEILDRHEAKVLAQGPGSTLEGDAQGFVTVLRFPSEAHARAWYHDPDYQEIKSGRLESGRWSGLLLEGVGPNHRAANLLPKGRSDV